MTIRIPEAFAGRMLRSYLTHTLALSTSALARLKADAHGITVNGQHVTVRYVLRAGDVLELADADTPADATDSVLPVCLPLSVLYEDEHVIALNKPAGMPTHPSHGHLDDTLANGLAYRYAQAGVPFVFRPLGRLDANTSGVVLAGKTQAAAGFLGRAQVRHEIVKRYLALVAGDAPADGAWHVIDAPIIRPDAGVIMRAVCEPGLPGAEAAITRYRVLLSRGGYSLVLAMPLTGRTHQIRVHLSHIGLPLLGDHLYGDETSGYAYGIRRHALHCLSLSVPMPFSRARGDIPDDRCNEKPDAHAALRALDPATPLNLPSADGFLHTWASLPLDMSGACAAIFGDAVQQGGHMCVGTLRELENTP